MHEPDGSENQLEPNLTGRPATTVKVAVVLVLAIAVLLRFLTKSPLWLDEALTVDISRRPLGQLPGLLKHDGAPPLYYVLLHYWMKAFGTGNLATRSLAGVFGVINLPVAWLAGYRIGSRSWTLGTATEEDRRLRVTRGKITAWSATLLLATSPFAVYYDTEARMYGLVLLLGTVAIVVATSVMRRATWRGALAVAATASALLYSHYWSLYVCAVAGLVCLWEAWRGPYRDAARIGIAGLVLAGISFLPWLQIFLFQLRHTGTPWAAPADYTAIVYTITQFAGGNSSAGRGLVLVFFFLFVLALFGIALDRRHVLLDLHTRPGVRTIAACVFAVLIIAIVAGRISGTTFADRYTSVVAFPALLVFAYGLTSIAGARARTGVLAVAVVFGLAASIPNVTVLRTQAGQVATALNSKAHRGDVIAYCPDQLGPSVSRLVRTGFNQVTFPRARPPQIVDWVNYLKVVEAASPYKFAKLLERRAGRHPIWFVSAPNYQGFGNDCLDIALELGRTLTGHMVVAAKPADTSFEVYEGMSLERFTPR
ncbi:MAG: glycosyltransferase family 39 protein [Acidimicrobiales bacterium]